MDIITEEHLVLTHTMGRILLLRNNKPWYRNGEESFPVVGDQADSATEKVIILIPNYWETLNINLAWRNSIIDREINIIFM